MKKFLSLVLALVMALSLTTVAWGATVVAKIGTDEYTSFAAALADVEDGETITIQNVAVDESGAAEVVYTNADDITFTITGDAPDYTFPRIEFGDDNDGGKITVNITSANLKIPVLGAYKNATVNVNNSTIIGKGYSQPTLKSYYNGAINISGGSVVYFHQITTMGYITVEGTGTKVTSTWQTQVLGNGLVTIKSGATYNTSALQLTGAPYKNRDNTDAARVGKPAEVIVDGGTLVVGEAYSASGADYSYESNAHGINIGTATDGDGVLTLKNNADVTLKQTGDTSTTHGGKISVGENGTVNVDNSTLSVEERGNNAGDVELQVAGNLNVSANSTVDSSTTSIAVQDGGTLKSAGDISGEISNKTNGTIEVTGGSYTDDVTNYVANGSTVTIGSNTVVKNENGTVAVNPVAQIGNTKYETLAAAVTAAAAGDTVKLLANNAENVTITKAITINFNGFTASGIKAADGMSIKPDGTVAATPSFATATTTKFTEDGTYYVLNASNVWEKVEYVPAEDDGDGTGNVAYFEGTSGTTYIVCKKTDDDALKLTSGFLAGDKLLNYVKAVATAEYSAVGTKVNASLYATCTTDVNLKGYVSVDATTGVKTYYVDAATEGAVGNSFILVDKQLVEVEEQVEGTDFIYGGHALIKNKAAAKDEAKTVYEYKCIVCGTKFDGVAPGNKAAGVTYIPYGLSTITRDYYRTVAGYDTTGVVTGAPGTLWLVKTSVPSGGAFGGTTSTDKVTSADTFDAGIAMYVGMSVMAAAGSAVVLKKKD